MVRRCVLLLLLCLGTGWICGCGSSRDRYIPASTTARQAVQQALDTWKSGAAHGPITSSNPAINVFDGRWRDGKKLDSYEIIEEIQNSDPPQFKVRMQLAGEPEETSTYLVIGTDPLNVFREQDYIQAQSM